MRTIFQRRASLFLAIAGAALLSAAADAAAQVSLATVVDLAQRNSTSVRLAQADLNKANAEYSESKDGIIPSLKFDTGLPVFPEVGFTGEPPSIYSVSIQSLVFGVAQMRYISAARLGQQAASIRMKDAREQVALDASTAYIALDTVNRELEAAQGQQSSADRLVKIEQDRAEAGVDSMDDLLQAQLTAAEVKLKRIHLESQAASLAKQLAVLTGLPDGSILPDHASIPEIPAIRPGDAGVATFGVQSAQVLARSKQMQAKGDKEINYLPQMGLGVQYNRNTTLLNDVNSFFARPLPANNFSSGFSIQVPLFDMVQRAKARASAADALRATVEAEDAQRQNEIQIADLNGNLRELDARAEVASLKQQIAANQLKSVRAQLEFGNGAEAGRGSTPQLPPKAEQLAQIDEAQKAQDALDAGLDLAKARLSLLRALGHMSDWLNELKQAHR
ncbi:MAG: TolC family protein [Terracidiphilus sp.]